MAKTENAPDFEVVSGREIKRVADKLREVDAKLPGQLRKDLRKVATTGAKTVKGRARSLSAKGTRGGTSKHPHKRKQLRRQVARGVRVQASTGGRKGAGLRIVTTMPAKDAAMLPRGLDSSWRHPVFGNTGNWAEQDGASWFREPLAQMRPAVEKQVRAVIDQAATQIASAGR